MILWVWSTNDVLDKCLLRTCLFHGNHGWYFFLSFKPSKRTLQMIFLITSSSFGERFKLKTSFSLNDNMMTELMVYYVTKRVLPARRFAF